MYIYSSSTNPLYSHIDSFLVCLDPMPAIRSDDFRRSYSLVFRFSWGSLFRSFSAPIVCLESNGVLFMCCFWVSNCF